VSSGLSSLPPLLRPFSRAASALRPPLARPIRRAASRRWCSTPAEMGRRRDSPCDSPGRLVLPVLRGPCYPKARNTEPGSKSAAMSLVIYLPSAQESRLCPMRTLRRCGSSTSGPPRPLPTRTR
jgi:hypothetical protein